MDNKKTALFGGSFDPIHLGHLFLLHCAIQKTDYERFVLVPANMSNFKQDRQLSASPEQRMDMIEIALADYRRLYPNDRKVEIEISSFELTRGGVSYTYDTVCHLIEKYSLQDRLGLLMGDDHIERLPEWYRFDELKEKVQFVICPRDGRNVVWEKIPKGINYLKIEVQELSPANSTRVRNSIARYMTDLSDGVARYINELGLYSCTEEELKQQLKTKVSEKRYLHSIGVAETTEKILEHYNCRNYCKEWKGIKAGIFCGLVHDLAREIPERELVDFCRNSKIETEEEFYAFPVLLHGAVSAEKARQLVGNYPDSWYRAIVVHTVGDDEMDELALALFVADFIEPSRVFMTDEKRQEYLSNPSIEACAYAVLCDMMKHWQTKENFQNAKATFRMKSFLENKLGKQRQ